MTEMKDLGKGLFVFAWLQGAQMKTAGLTKPSPHPLAPERGEPDLKEDRPEGGQARQGGCFSSRTGWPGGKEIPLRPQMVPWGFSCLLRPPLLLAALGFMASSAVEPLSLTPFLSCLSPEWLAVWCRE